MTVPALPIPAHPVHGAYLGSVSTPTDYLAVRSSLFADGTVLVEEWERLGPSSPPVWRHQAYWRHEPPW